MSSPGNGPIGIAILNKARPTSVLFTCNLPAEPVKNGESSEQPEAEEAMAEEPATEESASEPAEKREGEIENGKAPGNEDAEAEQEEEDDQEYEVVDDTEATTETKGECLAVTVKFTKIMWAY